MSLGLAFGDALAQLDKWIWSCQHWAAIGHFGVRVDEARMRVDDLLVGRSDFLE